jgi:hypothetical protein
MTRPPLKVDIEDFGRFLSFFGPLEAGNGNFLENVCICSRTLKCLPC